MILSDASIFDPALPRGGEDCLRELAKIPSCVREDERAALHASIIESAAALEQPLASSLEADSPEHREYFARTVLLWASYADSGGNLTVDTIRCRTLRKFPVDLQPTAETRAILRRALADELTWSSGQLDAVESEVAHLVSNLRLKQAVATAIAEMFAAKPSPHHLMSRVYGALPFREEDVDLVVTASGVFFCLPYEGEVLVASGFAERSLEERAAAGAFLRTVHGANLPDTDRFPSFGYFDRARVDPNFVDELTEKLRAHPGLSGVRPEVVAESFATMVQLLPTHLADQYLIHDNWGHGWQEALCEFEWLYAKLSSISEPLAPDSGPYFGGEDTPRLATAFSASGLDEARFLAVVERDLRGRVLTAINGVLSEMLADLVEHKYVRYAAMLPTSSIFPHAPLKLDLTQGDVDAHVRLCFSAHRRFSANREERDAFAAALGVARASVDQAAAVIDRKFGSRAEQALAARIMLLAASFDRELGRWLAAAPQVGGDEPWRRPTGSIDLLTLALAYFYEQNRAEYFWHLPALVREGLPASLRRLEAAISRHRAL